MNTSPSGSIFRISRNRVGHVTRHSGRARDASADVATAAAAATTTTATYNTTVG